MRCACGSPGIQASSLDLIPLERDLQRRRDFSLAAGGHKRRKLLSLGDLNAVAGREQLLRMP